MELSLATLRKARNTVVYNRVNFSKCVTNWTIGLKFNFLGKIMYILFILFIFLNETKLLIIYLSISKKNVKYDLVQNVSIRLHLSSNKNSKMFAQKCIENQPM